MPEKPSTGPAPDSSTTGSAAPPAASSASTAPGVMTALICEQCGNVNLVRVKGCWYCEKCHYKFDCYGF